MINKLFYEALLLGAAALCVGCTSSEDFATKDLPPEQTVWPAVINRASQGDVTMEDSTGTRALFVGGYTDRFLTAWDNNDVVKVYKGTSYVGSMTPNSEYWGTYVASLTGTLTGPFTAGDQLTLYLPSKEIDLTGQNGTMQSVSAKSYQTTSASVASTADNILTLSDVKMSHRLTYIRLRFTDEEGGARLHPSQLILHPISGGNPVLKMDADGNVTETGDIVLNMTPVENEYPGDIYLAMLNENDAVVTYNFKATVGSDVYVGPVSTQNAYGPNIASTKGELRGAVRMLRKTTALTSGTISVADIPSKVFTGSAIVPANTEIVVKDGDDDLTQGTDYLYEISNNVNVGEATVSITGQADKLAQAQTKYIGNIVKTFQITQATPVITMPTEDEMTLEVSLTRQRAVTSVTLDNSAFSLADLDIMADPYNCTITYSSANPTIATVSSDGTVTGVATGTTTITVTVAEAQNWTSQTKTYTVKVSPRVNTSGNATWTVNEDAESGNVYQ